MDSSLYSALNKKIKQMAGANYVSSTTRTDDSNTYLDITFKKEDGTLETTTLTFPIGGGGGGLEQWQSNLLEQLKSLQKENTLYYREGSQENPQEGDRRDTGLGLGRNGDEVFSNGEWIKKIEVGSVGTDMITLRDGLNDIKVKEAEKTYNLIRKLKTMNGIQVGSSFIPLALTGDDKYTLKYFYPDKNNIINFIGQGISNSHVELPCTHLLRWDNKDAIVKSFRMRAEEDSRIRLRVYRVEEGRKPKIADEFLVYESMPDTEFKNPENPNCGGVLVPQGESEIDLRNEMYLTNGNRYLLSFEALKGENFAGDSDSAVPYFEINYYEEKNSPIVTYEILQDILENVGGMIPKLIYSKAYSATAGKPTPLPIYYIQGVTKDDVFWVTCGNRGQAIQVTDPTKLEMYSASYYTDAENKEFVYYMEEQGMDTKDLAVYKFTSSNSQPAISPYIYLNDVIEDITPITNKGDRFNVDVIVENIETLRNALIELDFRTYSYTTPLLFDGREKWYFEFPFQTSGWNKGDKVRYSLSWRDTRGLNYNGFEEVVKDILI